MSKELSNRLRVLFVKVGVLPFLLVIALVIFTILSDKFLTVSNLMTVARQSTYLIIVAIGQMFALLTGGFDLSVGSIMAISSVACAMAMVALGSIFPESVYLVITLGVLTGLATGLLVGALNGVGISIFGVSPFIMTLGISSTVFGVALYLTGGIPISDLPVEFSDFLGFGFFLGIPIPVLITFLIFISVYVLLSHTIFGRYFYATGGNINAAKLSGINTKSYLFSAYVMSAFLASIAGILLTARVDSGEANMGASFPLESIAACIIAGVSLRGGIGTTQNVILGAFFITLMQNGMNLARIESYLQIVVIGVLLIIAVLADRVKQNVSANIKM